MESERAIREALGAARIRSSEAVRVCSPLPASHSHSADWHFPFLSPHGGLGCQLLLHFLCLQLQTPFVSYSPQILGEDSGWPVWTGRPPLNH